MSTSTAWGSTPEGTRRRLTRAGEALRQGRLEEARRLLEVELARDPEDPRALNLLGLVYFKLGRLEASRAVYDRLVQRYPNEAPLHVNLGLVMLRQGNLTEAEAEFRTALSISPRHRRAHCYLGLVLYRRGELNTARAHFIKGDAQDLARKVDSRLSGQSTPAPTTSSVDILDDVSKAAEVSLSSDPQPFRSVDLDVPSPPSNGSQQDDGWEATVKHRQPIPVADAAEASLLSVTSPYQVATGRVELKEVAEAAAKLAPAMPDLLFNLELTPRARLSPDDVEALESGIGRSGFVAGPMDRAKVTVKDRGLVRAKSLVLAFGEARIEPGDQGTDWWEVRGPCVLLLSVPGIAAALRNLRDASFRSGVLMGFEGGLELRPNREGGPDRLRGKGSALIRSPGAPLLVPLREKRTVVTLPEALLGWSRQVQVLPASGGAAPGHLECTGPGWVLVSSAA